MIQTHKRFRHEVFFRLKKKGKATTEGRKKQRRGQTRRRQLLFLTHRYIYDRQLRRSAGHWVPVATNRIVRLNLTMDRCLSAESRVQPEPSLDMFVKLRGHFSLHYGPSRYRAHRGGPVVTALTMKHTTALTMKHSTALTMKHTTARARPAFGSARAGAFFLFFLSLPLRSGPDFNHKFHVIITADASSVCCTSRLKLCSKQHMSPFWFPVGT